MPTPPVIALRDAIAARLHDPAVYTLRKTNVPQLQPDQLPALSILVMDGEGTPDGDGNAGEPRFVEDDTIGISVARAVEDPAVAEGDIAAEVEAIKDKLFTDPTFVHYGPDALFESIVRTRRRWFFPQMGETYFVELRLEITFRGRTFYPPEVPDEYRELAVTEKPGDRVADPQAPTITRKWVQSTWDDQFASPPDQAP